MGVTLGNFNLDKDDQNIGKLGVTPALNKPEVNVVAKKSLGLWEAFLNHFFKSWTKVNTANQEKVWVKISDFKTKTNTSLNDFAVVKLIRESDPVFSKGLIALKKFSEGFQLDSQKFSQELIVDHKIPNDSYLKITPMVSFGGEKEFSYTIKSTEEGFAIFDVDGDTIATLSKEMLTKEQFEEKIKAKNVEKFKHLYPISNNIEGNIYEFELNNKIHRVEIDEKGFHRKEKSYGRVSDVTTDISNRFVQLAAYINGIKATVPLDPLEDEFKRISVTSSEGFEDYKVEVISREDITTLFDLKIVDDGFKVSQISDETFKTFEEAIFAIKKNIGNKGLKSGEVQIVKRSLQKDSQDYTIILKKEEQIIEHSLTKAEGNSYLLIISNVEFKGSLESVKEQLGKKYF